MILIDYRPFELCSLAYVKEENKIIHTQEIASQPEGLIEGLKALIKTYGSQTIYIPELNRYMLDDLQNEFPELEIIIGD